MSVQLVIYPQTSGKQRNIDFNPNYELAVDGQTFTTVNGSTNISSSPLFTFIALYATYDIPINTWARYSSGASANVTMSDGNLECSTIDNGISQTITQLDIGSSYDIEIDVIQGTWGIHLVRYTSEGTPSLITPFPNGYTTSEIGTNIFTFTAEETNFTEGTSIVMFVNCTTANSKIGSISVKGSTVQGTRIQFQEKIIADLYEEESIPLTLSIDNFTNAAEQTQSYSKAFDLPGTKKNNLIFNSLYEITRQWNFITFNTHMKTRCEIKEDGFLIFEGYLRMLDVKDNNGEISYSVNVYSEVITIADILKERTFKDLDLVELTHEYNKTQIKYSWNDSGTGITWDYPGTSGFRGFDTLKYPFVDWAHQYTTDISGNPILPSLESVFRPWIQIKYLIDRIFQSVNDFQYTSTFLNTDDFKKLYMDFNWGTGDGPANLSNTLGCNFMGSGGAWYAGNGTWTPLLLNTPAQELEDNGYNHAITSGEFTATDDNTHYTINYTWRLENVNDAGDIDFRWLLTRASGTTEEILLENNVNVSRGYFNISANYSFTLDAGDKLVPQFKSNVTANLAELYNLQSVSVQITVQSTTEATMLQNLRGETNQWEFLKGIFTMFNLVSMPDKDNPYNIIIEPYEDIFYSTQAGTTLQERNINHDWTEKVDISQMSLNPLPNLKSKTIFKYVDDDDDYLFRTYKNATGGYSYGSKVFEVPQPNVFDGVEEIVASPFAATLSKILDPMYPQLIVPSIYSYNPDDGSSESFENKPRICYNNGKVTMTNRTYHIPAQAGLSSENQPEYLQFSHLTEIPSTTNSKDFNFGECQYLLGMGDTVVDNLFNSYWAKYIFDLYDPDTRIMTLKVFLTAADLSLFQFNETVFIKNREFRVNKIDYQPGQLSTVEFILIP